MTNNRWQTITIVSLVILAVLELYGLIAIPLQGYDSSYHIFWVNEWHKLWQEGIYFPRWLPDSFNGLGAPTFYFYGPLTYVISSALFACFGALNTVAIIKLLVVVTLLASGITMWMYLRWRGASRNTAFIATAIYCVAPYRYFDYAVRSAISEHVAFIFIPLVFWGIELWFENDRAQRLNGFFLLSLSFALLLITNIAASVAILLAICVYIAVKMRSAKELVGIIAAFAVSGLLAAFQLLPMGAFSSDIHLGTLWIAPSVIEISPLTAVFLGHSYATNVFNILGFVCAALLLYTSIRNKNEGLSKVILLMLAIIFFLYLPYVSRAAFNFVPILKIIQRPERLGILILLLFTLWWASGASDAYRKWSAAVLAIWIVGVTVMVGIWAIGFHVHRFGPPPVGDAREYTPRWSHSGEEQYVNTYAAFDNVNVWTQAPETKINRITQTSYSTDLEYQSNAAERLTLRKHYWPGWSATIDGKASNVESDSLGRVSLPVPAGQHHVSVTFEELLASKIGGWVSIFSALLFFAAFFVVRKPPTASRSLRAQ